jgi:hypothetical protein
MEDEMKQALDRFVRALAERELAADAPETIQDLGTFVDWLAERLGFDVHLRAYKYGGLERRKSSGRLQLGADMLATKQGEGGTAILYRFVLKVGPVSTGVWGRSGDPGNIVHDVRLAAGRNLARDHEDFDFGTQVPASVVVVAVHNGDFDAEALGGSRAQLRDELAKQGVGLEWWDAGELVRLAVPLLAKGPDGDEGGDAGLFPPGVRPFARLALESLRRDPRSFDYRALDEYLDARLPLGRALSCEGAKEKLERGEPLPALALMRQAAELPLFTSMLLSESFARPRASTLPLLDALEHCACRVAEHAQRHDDPTSDVNLRKVRETLKALLGQYVDVAQRLQERLTPLCDIEYGLAIARQSEPVDYPLRCYRLLGYLAVAGLVSLDLGNEAEARKFGDTVAALWERNDAACESPVTDDQVIELTAIWSLLLRLGLEARVGQRACSLMYRACARRVAGMPLPGVYQRASIPINDRDARILATVHAAGRKADAEFVDESSTLLTIAAYVAYKHGQLDEGVVERLRRGIHEPQGREIVPACSFQIWQPPLDAADEWYAHEIAYRGVAHQFLEPQDREAFLKEFEEQARQPQASYGQRVGLSSLDLIAWKRWRTLPDFSIVVQLPVATVEVPVGVSA